MVSSSNRVDVLLSTPAGGTTASRATGSNKSFSSQLASEIAQGRSEAATSGAGASRASTAAGQTLAGRQDLAAASGAERAIDSPLTTTSSTSSTSDIPTMLGMGPVAGTAPVQVPAAAASQSGTQEMTEADAYWAAQPAAVQQLRYMPEGPAKDALAQSLEDQGYAIDTQIMVWGWDPQMTMIAREAYGYTWVPSYGQPAILVQPGISDPFQPSTYNPDSPPAGSIIVSTAFANGTIQNPLVQTQTS